MTLLLMNRDESELIHAICQGDSQLFHDLVRPYERKMFVTAFSIVQNEADAEEVLQDALLNAFKGLPRFRGEAKFSTWLARIVVNEARLRFRRNSRVPIISLDAMLDSEDGEYHPAQIRSWEPLPLEVVENEEIRLEMKRAIEELPDSMRSVFLLRDVQGLNIKETSEALGISIAAVKIRLLRARLRLQRTLAPELQQMARPQWKRNGR